MMKFEKGQWIRRVALFRAMNISTEDVIDIAMDYVDCKDCPVMNCPLKSKSINGDWSITELKKCEEVLTNWLK